MGRLTLNTACPARSLQLEHDRCARKEKEKEFETAVMALWTKNASQEQLSEAWARKKRREHMQRKLKQAETRLESGMDAEYDDDGDDNSTVDSAEEEGTIIDEIEDIFETVFGAFRNVTNAIVSVTDDVKTERRQNEREMAMVQAKNKAKRLNGARAALELESVKRKNRELGLDKLLKKLAKEEKRLKNEDRKVMETRRQIRAAAAAVNMQTILDDYEDYDDEELTGRIRDAFGDLGSVSSVAQDVLEINSRLCKTASKHVNKALFPHE